MTTDRSTATGWLRDLAAGRWDAALADRGGFSRPASSVTYARKVSDGGRQRIHLDLFVRPPHAPDAFHLSPRCSVSFPDVARISIQLLGRHAGGFGKSGIVDIGLLDLIAPESPMFLFASAEQLARLGPDIERYLLGALVPYLDERISVAALTAAKRREWLDSGAEPGNLGRYPIVVAAGYLAMGDADQARKTLDTAYPAGTRARDHYADAFAVVEAGG